MRIVVAALGLVAVATVTRADDAQHRTGAPYISQDCLDNPLSGECEHPHRKPPPDRGEIVNPPDSVTTWKSHAELSQFLVAPAARAVKAKDPARAIPLYLALVAARGAGGPEGKQLAELYAQAGDASDAATAWSAYAASTTDPAERTAATEQATRLATAADPFADKLALAPDVADARSALAAARTARAAKHPADARVDLELAYALAPELPTVVHDLAAAYTDAGEPARAADLYRSELRARPFGANAELARKELGASSLGTLAIGASLPCTEIWVNRTKLPGKLPEAGVLVAPGTYKGLCFNPKYEMALFEYAEVTAGGQARMQFDWAIVVNQLAHPYGRIAVENAKAPGVMIDLGITSPEVGVAVPADHRPLKVSLTDDTGQRREARTVRLDAGQRLVIQW